MKPASSPLPSLLALAAGASALPLAAEAAIIHTDLGPYTVGFGSGQLTSLTIDLPGIADLGFNRSTGAFSAAATHRIIAGQAAGYVRFGRQANSRSAINNGLNVAFRSNAGGTWNNAARLGQSSFGNVIRSWLPNLAPAYTVGPGAFSNKYILFKFTNTAAADQVQYGWVSMSAATITPGTPANMSVTLSGWAYDNTGATIAAGAIPEPGSAALAMGGALVLGAAGLRRWRKRNAAAAMSAA